MPDQDLRINVFYSPENNSLQGLLVPIVLKPGITVGDIKREFGAANLGLFKLDVSSGIKRRNTCLDGRVHLLDDADILTDIDSLVNYRSGVELNVGYDSKNGVPSTAEFLELVRAYHKRQEQLSKPYEDEGLLSRFRFSDELHA